MANIFFVKITNYVVKYIWEVKAMNNRLKEVRKQLGLTQQELANKLSVNYNSVSQWERGVSNITDRVINQICSLFNVNKEWFVNGKGEMFKVNNQEVIDNLNERLDGLSEAEIEFLRKWLQLSYEERVYIFDKIKFLFGDVWSKKNTD